MTVVPSASRASLTVNGEATRRARSPNDERCRAAADDTRCQPERPSGTDGLAISAVLKTGAASDNQIQRRAWR